MIEHLAGDVLLEAVHGAAVAEREEGAGLAVHDLVHLVVRPQVMLQRHRPLRRRDHVHLLLLRPPTGN